MRQRWAISNLVQRAWFLVYGPRTSLLVVAGALLGGEWSRAVRAIGPIC
jgi:uncharacterized protein with ACT and thioredoxin-like domain